MIIDIHSHIGDPWYAYWKKNVKVEDHLASMDKWGIDKRCVSWWQPHNAQMKGMESLPTSLKNTLTAFSVSPSSIQDGTGNQ